MGRRITVGRVSGAHGVRGELRVLPLTDFPERFYKMKSLPLYRGEEEICLLPVSSVRMLEGKGLFLIQSDELKTRDEAEALKGALVSIDETERESLPEGHFWIDDLIGMEVFDEAEGTLLGKVRDVLRNGATDLYWIDGEDGKEHFVPAVEEFIAAIDGVQRRITIRLMEGLWN